jgi:hypothetical protein
MATIEYVEHRKLTIKLPPDLSNERYAVITHTVFSVLEAAGVGDASSVFVDEAATDAELNDAFDEHSERYPWGA